MKSKVSRIRVSRDHIIELLTFTLIAIVISFSHDIDSLSDELVPSKTSIIAANTNDDAMYATSIVE